MRYENVVSGKFIARPNRFIAEIEIDGKTEICHIMNTGRMKELLVPGAKVFLTESKNPVRKTKYDLVAVENDGRTVNIDSLAPNKIAGEYIKTLFPEVTFVRPETVFGNSRFDFYAESPEEKIFLEVKGVTLLCETEARFPDAPTERGAKHLRELIKAKESGFRAAVLFVIAMKGAESFAPNAETDPNFAKALSEAKAAGVEIYAVDCRVSPDEITADKRIKVKILKNN